MTDKLQTGGHSIYTLNYHIVWCVKYRHTLLTREIGDRVKQLIRELAREMDCLIEAVETDTDHVHILVKLKPTHELARVIHRFKGTTARRIFQEFPQLRRRLWGGHLWSPSYYAATVGGAPLETVKQYVESQRDKQGV